MMEETKYDSLSGKSTIQLPYSTVIQLPKRSFISRLFEEYPGVRGCGWFARHAEQRFHVFWNVVRVLSYIVFAPFVLAFPIVLVVFMMYLGISGDNMGSDYDDNDDSDEEGDSDDDDDDEETYYDIPIAVLRHPPEYRNSTVVVPHATYYDTGSNASTIYSPSNDVYETTNFEPHWMLEVQVLDGKYANSKQIVWEGHTRGHGYTAISYPIESAQILFERPGEQGPKPKGKKYSPADRRHIAKHLLKEYCSAKRAEEVSPNRTEYIWLDEFCISDARNDYEGFDDAEISRQRKEELSRIPDIFRGAATVVAFCHKPECKHVTLGCPWGKRLFTLGEILHAQKVACMTRIGDHDHHCSLSLESAQSFRERMMHHAAQNRKWHLHSLLRNSVNGGGDTWQSAIHALMVEAIRRDVETNFLHHELLGQGLNGLLPRRAHAQHLKGKDGWADLAWLLELNQGFYNAASLAAVCGLNENPSSGHGWLGPPIEPKAGNERLEPLVHAFPVGAGKDKVHLNIVGAKTIALEPYIKRNSDALYRIPAFKWKKIASMALLAVFWLIGFIFLLLGATTFSSDSPSTGTTTSKIGATRSVSSVSSSSSSSTTSSDPSSQGSATNIWIGILLIYLSSIAFNLFHLIVSSWYIERSGWVFLSSNKLDDGSEGDSAWGTTPETRLKQLDSGLEKLVEWGDEQMVPKWNTSGPQFKIGHLIDLRSRTKAQVVVTKRPNSIVVLGIHGSGVTCMLLNRPDGENKVAEKVGMVNLPPYILAQTERSGSLRVGIEAEENKKDRWASILQVIRRFLRVSCKGRTRKKSRN
ncbi:hypothetical protein VKT23_009721 [Stygiomarasmius scandens]|uniref:Heterokaryon incompatibility domain-containing protein n=1 Tax=Marasmiellus scandens TaxID=2682957 RepID=A0ABR1JDT2_9AGAR